MKAITYSVAYSAAFEPVPVEVKMGPNSTVHALHEALCLDEKNMLTSLTNLVISW